MTETPQLPVSTKQINCEDSFSFSCHKGVSCFTQCCRMLELALSPYDVLRLRHSTGLSSTDLLEQYIIVEQEQGEPFPRFYLTMIDDGRASCVFVSNKGCTVYKDRPAACRTYPLGRATQIDLSGGVREHFILVQEDHCQGFNENTTFTPLEYSQDQELTLYNEFNDLVAQVLLHEAIKKGFIPSQKLVELFTLALYDLDKYREMVLQGELMVPETKTIDINNDEQLLRVAISWISEQLYSYCANPGKR